MIHKFFKQKNKSNSGFTLVETLVAISIFSLAVLALMSVLSQGITNTTYAKTKITASYLAQEGIEYIRNMRDTFVLYDTTSGAAGWTKFNNKLTTNSCDTAGCYFDDRNVDYTNHSQPMANLLLLTGCSNVPCTNGTLLYDAPTGKYGYASGTSTSIIRKIKTAAVSANETRVTSTVTWNQGSGTYSVVFSESLFNWVD